MSSLQKKVFLSIAGTLVVVLLIGYILSITSLKKKHVEEMHQIIQQKGGEFVSYEKVSVAESPFDGGTTGNVIYKIVYTLNGEEHIAWYRGTKVINNIHMHAKGDYPEAWIFEK